MGSSALLMTSGSAFGIVYVVIWGANLPTNGEKYENQWNFSSYFLVGNGLVMLMFMCLFNGEYKRMNTENQYKSYIEDLNEEDISIVESDWSEKAISPKKIINGPDRTPVSVNKQSPYHYANGDNSKEKRVRYNDSF